MNLYLISQDFNLDDDTYDSAVVAANTEIEAVNTHPRGPDHHAYPDWMHDWVTDLSLVKVKFLGVAHEGIEAGVICASFNAG